MEEKKAMLEEYDTQTVFYVQKSVVGPRASNAAFFPLPRALTMCQKHSRHADVSKLSTRVHLHALWTIWKTLCAL